MKKIALKRKDLNNPVIQAYSRAVQMGYASHHVLPSTTGWAVKKAGASRASRIFTTQREAIQYGRTIAKNRGQELIIHNKDGRIGG